MISNNVEFLPPIFYAVLWQPFWKCRITPLIVTYHYVKFYVSIRGSKGVGVTIESYGKVEISYINVDNF
jgi:hypothetical protein